MLAPDPKKIAVAILSKKGSGGDGDGEGEGPDGLEAASQDLVDALKAGSAKDVAAALRSAFELLESQPHEESEE